MSSIATRRLRPILLTSLMLAATTPVFAASFDCTQARLADEKAICASRQLSEMDVEMAVRYQMMTGLVGMGARGSMQDAQQTWLNDRKQCAANTSCLVAAYRRRIQTLKDGYAGLKSRGPF